MELKELDSHKLIYHPDKVAEWRRTGDCYPVHIEIGATGKCNQRCVFCALDWVNHKGCDMDRDVLVKALEDMAKHEVRSVMFGGEGEPFMHKDLPLFVRKSKEYGLDVSITTNGVLFTEEKMKACLPYLSWIKFSIDAGNAKQYAEIHKTPEKNFEILLSNIRNAVEYKREKGLEATIGTQFLMIPESITGARELAERLREFEPDYLVVKPYSFHPKSKHNEKVVSSEDYHAIDDALKDMKTKKFNVVFRAATINRITQGNDYPECYGLPFISLIDSKGNVLPCNLFYDNPDLIYGNLYENSFSEIWEGEKRKEVLAKIKQNGSKDCRNGCRCDVINRYLHRLRYPQAHDNFT